MRTALVVGAAILAGTVACTPVGYTKPGLTDEVFTKDSAECTEIARHQAFRDSTRLARRTYVYESDAYGVRTAPLGRDTSGFGELAHRYFRICMLARGYELAPLDES